MLFLVKTWDNLEKENNINNLFIKGIDNMSIEPNINKNRYNKFKK